MTRPVPPIELTGTASRFGEPEPLPDGLATHDRSDLPTSRRSRPIGAVAEASRDWWPLGLHWSLAGRGAAARRGGRCDPTTEQVAAVLQRLRRAHASRSPPAAGRSGVCGALGTGVRRRRARPDRADRIGDVDATSGVVEVGAGTFGPDLERELRTHHGLTVGHFPQSFELATVGGWVACRGAGQYSTRYGKIEDMVVGLEVVLADGTRRSAPGAPPLRRSGPISPAVRRLRGHARRDHPGVAASPSRPAPSGGRPTRSGRSPTASRRAGGSCARRHPAVLRLYDAVESERGRGGDGTAAAARARRGRRRSSTPRWHRRRRVRSMGDAADEPARRRLARAPQRHLGAPGAHPQGLRGRHDGDRRPVEPSRPTSTTPPVGAHRRAPRTRRELPPLAQLPRRRVPVLHVRRHPATRGDRVDLRRMWDAGQRAVLASGGNLSHHHGVGLNRARFVAEALGPAFDVLAPVKRALDPNGILNPGKLPGAGTWKRCAPGSASACSWRSPSR
jgi:alkyldihydroxyacetonephosphate synthase